MSIQTGEKKERENWFENSHYSNKDFVFKNLFTISIIWEKQKTKNKPWEIKQKTLHILLKKINYYSDATIERDFIFASLALISSKVVVLSLTTSIWPIRLR